MPETSFTIGKVSVNTQKFITSKFSKELTQRTHESTIILGIEHWPCASVHSHARFRIDRLMMRDEGNASSSEMFVTYRFFCANSFIIQLRLYFLAAFNESYIFRIANDNFVMLGHKSCGAPQSANKEATVFDARSKSRKWWRDALYTAMWKHTKQNEMKPNHMRTAINELNQKGAHQSV